MIVVTGISGVGKTHTIRAFLSAYSGYRYLRASEVLSDLGRPTSNLSAEDARQNQEAIREAVSRLAVEYGDRLIVDGHAVIETAEGPMIAAGDVYGEMNLSGILTIVDDVEPVQTRRLHKPIAFVSIDIAELQRLEVQVSSAWAKNIGKPFAIVKSGDVAAFADKLIDFRRRGLRDAR